MDQKDGAFWSPSTKRSSGIRIIPWKPMMQHPNRTAVNNTVPTFVKKKTVTNETAAIPINFSRSLNKTSKELQNMYSTPILDQRCWEVWSWWGRCKSRQRRVLVWQRVIEDSSPYREQLSSREWWCNWSWSTWSSSEIDPKPKPKKITKNQKMQLTSELLGGLSKEVRSRSSLQGLR